MTNGDHFFSEAYLLIRFQQETIIKEYMRKCVSLLKDRVIVIIGNNIIDKQVPGSFITLIITEWIKITIIFDYYYTNLN